MTLPHNLDEAAAFLGALTPADLANLRLGLVTVLVIVAATGLLVWALAKVARRG
jgi:hypothetical protein